MTKRTIAALLAACLYCVSAHAAEAPDPSRVRIPDVSQLADMLPSPDRAAALEAEMQANPHNLDAYFAYAQTSTATGDYEQAIQAYQHMLEVNPSLDRVRLDLGLAYSKMGRYEEAQTQFQEVLKKDIPEEVKYNIQTVLAQIAEQAKEHFQTGSISTGILHDSNANSASGTDEILVFDTVIPLLPSQQAREDWQFFASAALNHRYRPRLKDPKALPREWNMSIAAYQSEQQHLDELDIKLLSVRAGPTYTLPELKSNVSLTPGYTHVILDGNSYLRIYSADAEVTHNLSETVQLSGTLTHEYRDFINAPDVTTYTDRTGPADQVKFGVTHLATKQDIVDANIVLRHEDTKRTYYDNSQWAPTLGWTRQWEGNVFTRLEGSFRESRYDGPDPLISQEKRKDYEKSVNLTLGKAFDEHFTVSVNYQYRDVNSTIPNYDYDNHRVMTTVGVRF